MEALIGCGIFLLIAGATIGSVFLRAWVLTVLWGWFAVPLHLPPLTVALALGISVMIGLFRVVPYTSLAPTDDPAEKRKRYAHFTSQTLFLPLVSLLTGWLVHLFM